MGWKWEVKEASQGRGFRCPVFLSRSGSIFSSSPKRHLWHTGSLKDPGAQKMGTDPGHSPPSLITAIFLFGDTPMALLIQPAPGLYLTPSHHRSPAWPGRRPASAGGHSRCTLARPAAGQPTASRAQSARGAAVPSSSPGTALRWLACWCRGRLWKQTHKALSIEAHQARGGSRAHWGGLSHVPLALVLGKQRPKWDQFFPT